MPPPSLLDADKAYQRIRANATDVASISKHTGMKMANVQKVKEHLFFTMHWLDRYVALGVPAVMARFDSDIYIAQAWDRLALGRHTSKDLQLLRHEAAEAWYMRKIARSYSVAHNAAERRFPAPRWP